MAGMKPTLGIPLLLAVLCLPPWACRAGGDLDFSCVAKRVDQKTTKSGTSEDALTIDTEDWQYVVTLANTSFKDLANLEVRYIMFSKRQEIGTVAGTRVEKQAGSVKIDNIKGHDKVQFETITMKLQKATLAAGRYYANGGRTSGEASMSGLWIRIYQNGNLIAEMSRPPELATKEKWPE